MDYLTFLYEKRGVKLKLLKYLEESSQLLNKLMPNIHNNFSQLLYSKEYMVENKISDNNKTEEIIRNNEINGCDCNDIIRAVLSRLLKYDKLCMNNVKLSIDTISSSNDGIITMYDDFVWSINIEQGFSNKVKELLIYIYGKAKNKNAFSNAILLEELGLELEDENDNSYMDNMIKSYIDFYFIKMDELEGKIRRRVNKEIEKYKVSNSVELEMNGYKHPLFVSGANYLSFCLYSLSNIKLLDISWCGIEDEGFKYICMSFKNIKYLQELHSCCNKITDVGIKYLCENCENIPNLLLLDLRCNIFGLEGCNIIADNISKCPYLCNLWLDRDIFNDNEDIILNIKNKHPNKDLEVTLSNVFTGFI